MSGTRNPEATCKTCIHRWTGKENFMIGFDTVVNIESHRCTQDGMRPVRLNFFCQAHPGFAAKPNAGLKP